MVPVFREDELEVFRELIVTKLYPSVSRGGIVARDRLLDRLEGKAIRRLTLVTGPAGFGKTTLLAQWQGILLQRHIKCGWLSLDADDQDIDRFFHYFIGAVRMALPEFGQRVMQVLQRPARQNIASVIASIVNEVAEHNDSIAVFLDDFHLAESSTVNEAIQLLLHRAPNNLHLIVGSRSIPDWPLASLRVHDEIMMIDAMSLRFDRQESSDFIQISRGLELTPEQIDMLVDRTEGWVAGLQLASLSIGSRKQRDDFFETFSGSLRDIADYLATDVLRTLSADQQRFLLQTSVLDRLNADVCEHLTGHADAATLLEEIEANNLFLLPLDEQRNWYRYHHLFSDFLRSQLTSCNPLEFKALNLKASQWFAAQGLPNEAVNYALKAEAYDYVAELVHEHAVYLTWQGEMVQLNGWIRKIPEHVTMNYPRLPMFQCWALFHMRHGREAAKVLKHADSSLTRLETSAVERNDIAELERLKGLREEQKVLQAGIAIALDDINNPQIMEASEAFIRSERSEWLTAVMGNIYGYACMARSEFGLARNALSMARRLHSDVGAIFGVIYSDCFMGMLEMAEGNLHKAAALFQQAEDVALKAGMGPRTAGTAVARLLRAVVLYEWGRIDTALLLIEENLEVVTECGHIEVEIMGYITHARILAARGIRQRAEAVLLRAQDICKEESVGRQLVQVLDESVRLALAFGDTQAAFDIADDIRLEIDRETESETGRWDRISFCRDIISVRLLIVEGETDKALGHLAKLKQIVASAGRARRVLQCAVLESIALEKAGRSREALDCFANAVELGQREGYIRTIVDTGEEASHLIRRYHKQLHQNPEARSVATRRYLTQLVAALNAETPAPVRDTDVDLQYDGLIEPLSNREQEVLQLMAAGQVNREIAAELSIAENTVKWHVKNIFEKLGVTNRTAAAMRAREINFIK